MWRVFWTTAAVVMLFAVVIVYASANSVFVFKSPKDPDVRIVIDHETGAAVVQARATPQLLPRALVPEPEYNFGMMDPHSTGRHEFKVQNVGQAPLRLQLGDTSCKCTVGGLAKNELAPGEATTVTLEWNTGSKATFFSHYAIIRSNDKTQKEIELRITGSVRMLIGTELPELILGRLEPGQPSIADFYVYSQVWDQFEIQEIEHRLPGMKWEVTTVDPSNAPKLEAKSLRLVRLSLPAELTSADFQDTIRLSVTSSADAFDEGKSKTHFVDLPVHGNVLSKVTYFGGDIQNGAVDLGTVPFGLGKKTKVLIKIRDAEPDLGDVKLEVTPDLLQAQLVPRVGGNGSGLYDLHVTLPPDTPPCAFRSAPQGYVRITTSHPRIPKLEVAVRFAVLAKAGR
jgi:hypothetical protein